MKIQVNQFAKKKIEALVKKDMQEWPPGCAGWMYQPKQKPPIRHCTSQVNKAVTFFSMLYANHSE